MEVSVINTKPTFRRLHGRNTEKNPITLKLDPGATLVDADQLQLVRQNPEVEKLFTVGILSVKEAPKANKEFVPGNFIGSLEDLRVPDAILAIKACADVNQLKRWSETEPRKSVKAELIERHKSLVNPAEDKD